MTNQQNPVNKMPVFTQTIINFWRALFRGDALYNDEAFTISLNPDLNENSRLMVLETIDGRVMAVLTPALAEKAGLDQQQALSELIFRQKLNEAGITLHGADYLFYYTEAEKSVLLQEHSEGDLRRLTEQDESTFSEFASSASVEDLDDAYVELDHWAVFGSFEQNRLVSSASMSMDEQ